MKTEATSATTPVGVEQDTIHFGDKVIEEVYKTLREQILDRYATTGDDYQVMAYDHDLIPNTVNQWLRDAREKLDQRVTSGDLIRTAKEEAEEASLRAEFRLEGTSKTGLIFPEDDAVGTNLGVVNMISCTVTTDDGVADVPPYWTDAIAYLLDQREVPGPELIKAAKFPSELAFLRELRVINMRLAEAKLYILSDRAHYRLCRLL